MSIIKILKTLNISNVNNVRLISNTKDSLNNVATTFVNRNPRNLEKMCIAHKPVGYHLDKPGRSYWNK